MKLFETDDYIVIEMEYLSGGQLKRVFEKRLKATDVNTMNKPLFSEEEVASIAKGVL